MDSSAASSRSSCDPGDGEEPRDPPPVPLSGADWRRSQLQALRRTGAVWTIWGIETLVIVVIALVLALR